MARIDFERIYAEHAERLFGFLVYRTGERELAEDLVAETFETVYLTGRRFDPRKGSERTWLYAIALNKLRDHARRQGAESRAVVRLAAQLPAGGADSGPDSELERIEARDELLRLLARLSDEEREAISLRYGGGLSLREIARVTGEPVTTVEGRVYRALRKLRAALD
ncbi:MAG: RNA polymerase sigma factor [Solirubrobacteraceae bacterium]|nr:RNA polymerase sigma factor [Solirubrobacteraceae bacterium]